MTMAPSLGAASTEGSDAVAVLDPVAAVNVAQRVEVSGQDAVAALVPVDADFQADLVAVDEHERLVEEVRGPADALLDDAADAPALEQHTPAGEAPRGGGDEFKGQAGVHGGTVDQVSDMRRRRRGGTVYTVDGVTYIDLAGIAELLGVAHSSAAMYHRRSTRNRREGNPRPGDMPEPSTRFGQTPVWEQSVIQEWMKSRPGRGAGGNAAMLAARARSMVSEQEEPQK